MSLSTHMRKKGERERGREREKERERWQNSTIHPIYTVCGRSILPQNMNYVQKEALSRQKKRKKKHQSFFRLWKYGERESERERERERQTDRQTDKQTD